MSPAAVTLYIFVALLCAIIFVMMGLGAVQFFRSMFVAMEDDDMIGELAHVGPASPGLSTIEDLKLIILRRECRREKCVGHFVFPDDHFIRLDCRRCNKGAPDGAYMIPAGVIGARQ